MAINSTIDNHSKMDFPLANWTKDSVFAHSLTLVGRFLFSLIFIISSFSHFSSATALYAANQGVPFSQFLVPFSGMLALIGGLSILFGFHARFGAFCIILFLVPVTLTMHNFWTLIDAGQIQIQRAMFMKNLSMLGGALIIFNFGAGPFSIDERPKS